MRRLPQVLVNQRVAVKPPVDTLPAVSVALARAERELGEDGRVLVRYSGTEPLLRIMVEGEHEERIRELAEAIAAAARDAIGA